MRTFIYHRKHPTNQADLDESVKQGIIPFFLMPPQLVKAADYQLVAVMESPMKDEELLIRQAFIVTNSIENNWWEYPDPCVTPLAGPCRSTSVGDIIMCGDKAFQVEMAGLTDVSLAFFVPKGSAVS